MAIYMTSEWLARHPIPDKRTELVRGRLVIREPASPHHGEIAARILIRIGLYLHAHPIGTVYAAETGFTLARHPDTVRAPDVAYVRTDRIPAEYSTGFDAIAPDLVVEVRSRGDRASAVSAKVRHWLSAGTLLVWVVDPRKHTVHVHRADGTQALLTMRDDVDGEGVLPGFRVPVESLLLRHGRAEAQGSRPGT